MAKVTIGGRNYDVEVQGDAVIVDGQKFPITIRDDGGMKTVTAGTVQYRVQLPAVAERTSGMAIEVDYRPFTLEFEGRLGGGPAPRPARSAAAGAAPAAAASAVKGGISAQIAGRVLSVKVKVGDTVQRGDVVLLLEAMKMENEIKAPADGVVRAVLVVDGARVAEGETLVVVE